MGSIVERFRKDGSPAFMAKIILKRDGEIVHRETQTFDRRPAAVAWLARREAELRVPGAIARSKLKNPTLADAIDRAVAESRKGTGRSKGQVLDAIKRYPIAALPCEKITSIQIVEFATELAATRQPQTVQNYLSHLASIFAIARPAWGYPLDRQAMQDARVVLKRLGHTAKSRQRDRRPTLAELDKLMTYFADRSTKRPSSAPMAALIAFAVFSTRRQEEITLIAWPELDEEHSRILVRDMKHPGDKIGNDTWCDLTPEALAIIQAQPRGDGAIFPYSADAISAAFTRACAVLGIDNLHFHDLRHEGVSRLFELGWNIPHVATVSGHRSWQSLKRYSHIRQRGDKFAGWRWLDVVTKTVGAPVLSHEQRAALIAAPRSASTSPWRL